MRVPTQSKTFLGMTNKFSLRIDNSFGHTAMLGAIEDQNSSVITHCRNDVGILWLVSRLVNFSWVIDFLLNVHLDRSLSATRGRVAITADFSCLLIVVAGVWGDILRKLDVCDLDVVLGVVGSVCSDQESVYSAVSSRRSENI